MSEAAEGRNSRQPPGRNVLVSREQEIGKKKSAPNPDLLPGAAVGSGARLPRAVQVQRRRVAGPSPSYRARRKIDEVCTRRALWPT